MKCLPASRAHRIRAARKKPPRGDSLGLIQNEYVPTPLSHHRHTGRPIFCSFPVPEETSELPFVPPNSTPNFSCHRRRIWCKFFADADRRWLRQGAGLFQFRSLYGYTGMSFATGVTKREFSDDACDFQRRSIIYGSFQCGSQKIALLESAVFNCTSFDGLPRNSYGGRVLQFTFTFSYTRACFAQGTSHNRRGLESTASKGRAMDITPGYGTFPSCCGVSPLFVVFSYCIMEVVCSISFILSRQPARRLTAATSAGLGTVARNPPYERYGEMHCGLRRGIGV